MQDTTGKEFVVPRTRIGKAPLLLNKGEGNWLCAPKKSLQVDKGEPKNIARSSARRQKRFSDNKRLELVADIDI